jgi:chromosome segregation ATPase
MNCGKEKKPTEILAVSCKCATAEEKLTKMVKSCVNQRYEFGKEIKILKKENEELKYKNAMLVIDIEKFWECRWEEIAEQQQQEELTALKKDYAELLEKQNVYGKVKRHLLNENKKLKEENEELKKNSGEINELSYYIWNDIDKWKEKIEELEADIDSHLTNENAEIKDLKKENEELYEKIEDIRLLLN